MKKSGTQKFLIKFFVCFFLVANVWVENANGQMVYLPDTNFRNKLITLGYGSCIVGDSIDSSCPLVVNTTSLDVSFVSQEWKIQNLQGIQAFTNLTYLDCESQNFTTLPALPDSLKYLFCGFSHLTTLPSLPTSLLLLDCDGAELTSFPTLPISLIYLSCGSNFTFTSLPVLPDSLNYLYCGWNILTSLPTLPISLDTLMCPHNQLTNLPTLPSSLTYLECSINQLTNLPALPIQLSTLNCKANLLTNLPSLPSSLSILDCQSNQLISIPTLPSLLEGFNCSDNQLTTLPILPNSLKGFGCHHNQIINLPSLPNSLNVLHVFNNQITSIPELPDSLSDFNCSYNLNLNCLPRLKRIVNLFFDSTAISCLPNYGRVSSSSPPLNNIPLCGLFNPNGCNTFWNISGKSYFDSNSNCVFDSSDAGQLNSHVLLFKDGNLHQQIFTGDGGIYSFDLLDTGNYTVSIDTSNLSFDLLCPLINTYSDTITPTDSLFYDNDFALKCKAGFDLGAWSIEGRIFRPARQTTVNIHAGDISNFYGAHCANGISGSVTVIMDGAVSYVSPAPGALIPTTVSGDTISYAVADFGLVDLFSAFNIIVQTDTFAVSGTQVCFLVTVMPTAGDNNPSNNTLTHCFTVRASYDPNEKEVYPIGDIDALGNKWLTYTIHFQNTGTAPAEHIYITDTLDQNLDLASFQLLAYSHQPLVQILDGGIARFNFPNINLPDSNSNEPLSHGYIQYKIKLKDSTAVGTQISNTANIYFDFNPPVVTNTTVNTVTTSVGLNPVVGNGLQVSIFPNPSKEEFTVYCPKFGVGKKTVLRVFDTLGREIETQQVKTSNSKIKADHWASGIYFLHIETESGSVVKKLVRE